MSFLDGNNDGELIVLEFWELIGHLASNHEPIDCPQILHVGCLVCESENWTKWEKSQKGKHPEVGLKCRRLLFFSFLLMICISSHQQLSQNIVEQFWQFELLWTAELLCSKDASVVRSIFSFQFKCVRFQGVAWINMLGKLRANAHLDCAHVPTCCPKVRYEKRNYWGICIYEAPPKLDYELKLYK